ncbi:MAG TPA: adenosylcobinamide-GDP ribazoletransferase [Pyrinomonadaceae bacterium]|nr:adenosylcobinamide-GDP ribazoletransferase [Pyrinomonadaceae bacterium]
MTLILRRFLIAVQFLTRLPVPRRLVTTDKELGHAAGFFPLVGVVVGGAAAAVFVLTKLVAPLPVAVVLTLAFAAFITSGFHEDGLADTFDGLGGGWTRDRALAIMRDSRIGTYGALALIFLILGKYTFLTALEPDQVWRWLLVAHTASRWTILPLCRWLPYARAEGQGKLVARQITGSSVLTGSAAFLFLLSLLSWPSALLTIAVTVLVVIFSGLYFKRKLGGITGDCLGAVNQITEVVLYLIAVLLAR